MPLSSPQISVLVPCFDDGRFLDQALRSIAEQTFSAFEVVISDDGSTDDSVAVAEGWTMRDPRFRLIRNETNLGMTENWNRALSQARGELIAKLDADDLWRQGTLDSLRDGLLSSPANLVSFCRTEVADESMAGSVPWQGDAAFARAGFDPLVRQVEHGRRFWLLSLEDVQLWHSNAFLLRRADLERIGGFDSRWSCATDTALLLRLLGEDRPVVHLPYAGVRYRRRKGSVSDRFAESGWKSLEALLVRLDALARDARRFAPLPRFARQAWWQAWSSFGRMRGDGALWLRMPERLRLRLREASTSAVPPPLAIRCEGWLRLQAWRARAGLSRHPAAGASA